MQDCVNKGQNLDCTQHVKKCYDMSKQTGIGSLNISVPSFKYKDNTISHRESKNFNIPANTFHNNVKTYFKPMSSLVQNIICLHEQE